ncbi:MAG: hypothetical protein ACKOW1_03630 [Novosphingobium sp.]
MPAYPVRLFAAAQDVRRIGQALLDGSLPRVDWTHEAHLAACLWLITERPDIAPERDLPAIIRRYNESVGGVNDDSQGYHETLTQLYIRGVRRFLAEHEGVDLLGRVNALLASPVGERSWPLRFYSRAVLFSVKARRSWVEPDLAAL